MPLSSKEIIKILLKNGFEKVYQKGSHQKYKKESQTVIVPHPKKDIPNGTLKSIIRQSNLDKKLFNK